jgi:hypothetical protein
MSAQEIRPEPSRLEIAAMLIAGSLGNPETSVLNAVDALEMADHIIAAEKVTSLKSKL